jgi:hypothetical protein
MLRAPATSGFAFLSELAKSDIFAKLNLHGSHHENFRFFKQGSGALIHFQRWGGKWGGKSIFARFPRKKAGRGWHHHSRALRRRSMGQGG